MRGTANNRSARFSLTVFMEFVIIYPLLNSKFLKRSLLGHQIRAEPLSRRVVGLGNYLLYFGLLFPSSDSRLVEHKCCINKGCLYNLDRLAS